MIGLLGGTFDPIHCGHLDIAHAARRALGLERVLLIPSRIPPHRPTPSATTTERLAMVELAIAHEDGLEVSTIELDATGPSYTFATLERFAASGAAPSDFCFIAGADAFASITKWYRYPELLDLCHFAVVSRPGMPVEALREQLPELAPRMIGVAANQNYATATQASIFLIDAPTAPVSSTDVRAQIVRGAVDNLQGMVPDAVAAFITAHCLYNRLPPTEAHGH